MKEKKVIFKVLLDSYGCTLRKEFKALGGAMDYIESNSKDFPVVKIQKITTVIEKITPRRRKR